MMKILRLFYNKRQAELLKQVYRNVFMFLLCKMKLKKHSINVLVEGSASFIYADRMNTEETWDKILNVLPCTSIRFFMPSFDSEGGVQVFIYPIDNETKTFSGFLSSMRKVVLKFGSGVNPNGMFESMVESVQEFNAHNKKPFDTIVITDGEDWSMEKAFKKVKKPLYLSIYETPLTEGLERVIYYNLN